MTVWCRALILLCLTLNCVLSSSRSPRNKYNNSFRLSRSARTRVQQLLKKYKEEQLGNKLFEDRSRQLEELPLISTDFNHWRMLTDWERLHSALSGMQTYWEVLERKRRQLLEKGSVHLTFPQSIRHVQLDLRDLMSQVSGQMNYMRTSWRRPTFPPLHTTPRPDTSSNTVWDQRVEGYVILRDLDLYLIKLARDFLLLASKTDS